MDKLKFRYKLIIALFTLFISFPLLLAAINNDVSVNYLVNNPIVQNASIKYDIDLSDCLKCQDNGLLFGAVFLITFISIMLLSFFIMYCILLVILNIAFGWSSKKVFNILIKGQYPETWHK